MRLGLRTHSDSVIVVTNPACYKGLKSSLNERADTMLMSSCGSYASFQLSISWMGIEPIPTIVNYTAKRSCHHL